MPGLAFPDTVLPDPPAAIGSKNPGLDSVALYKRPLGLYVTRIGTSLLETSVILPHIQWEPGQKELDFIAASVVGGVSCRGGDGFG